MASGIVLDERYQMLPSMPPEQYEALKADIAERGVMVPIDITEDGYILDGHHRYRACLELGITDFSTIVRPGLTEEERRLFARNNNMLRRHLNRNQVRFLIAAQLRDTPSWANNRIAQALGVDKKTVQAERQRLESTGEIPKLTALEGADGKARKATRPAAVMAPNAEELSTILSRLTEGVEIEGFLSAGGLKSVVIQAASEFDGLTDDEKREWAIAIRERWIHIEDTGRICGRWNFRTPSEYFGPEGQAFMARIGCATKAKDLEGKWQATLRRYDGISLADLEGKPASKQPRTLEEAEASIERLKSIQGELASAIRDAKQILGNGFDAWLQEHFGEDAGLLLEILDNNSRSGDDIGRP